MKRILFLFIISLFFTGGIIFILCPSVSAGGISIWPPKITVNIGNWNYQQNIHQKIEVNNLNSFDINVTATVANPFSYRITENYINIPELSWIKVVPETIFIPAQRTGYVEVYITIPEDEREKYFNQQWESWVIFSEVKDASEENPSLFLINLATKFFIISPKGESKSNVFVFPFLISILFSIGIGYIIFKIAYSFKKQKYSPKNLKTTMFYFRKKKQT